MAAAAPSRPTPKLDNYVFTEKLGSGSYATVYKAYRKGKLREVVAVKCVLKSSLTRSSTENLLTEIELLKKLKHENIVALKDFQWDDQYIYLLMEFCTGGDLSKFIQAKRTISERSAKTFLQHIAKAIHYLHKNRVAHMDLKPQNILLSSRTAPTLKIADFGFAQHLRGDDKMIALRGSPLYMAPEILCHGQYDARVDLWSIGVIFYECLFGQAPFASTTYRELGQKIWDDKPVKLPHAVNVSDDCRSLLHGLLQRDPDKRMTFQEFFDHPFVDFEHIPSAESLEKAKSLVREAIADDEKGDIEKALNLYCSALAHFVPAIQFEDNSERKDALRVKVSQYVQRAELLKSLFSPKSFTDSSTCSASLAALLEKLIQTYTVDTPETVAALRLLTVAEAESDRDSDDKALDHYELALGHLIPLLSNETNGERKELLKNAVTRAIEKAEYVKLKRSARRLMTAKVMQQEFVDEPSHAQCILQ